MCGYEGLGVQGGDLLQRGMREFFKVMGYGLCLYVFVKMHRTVYLKWMGFNDFKFTSINL